MPRRSELDPRPRTSHNPSRSVPPKTSWWVMAPRDRWKHAVQAQRARMNATAIGAPLGSITQTLADEERTLTKEP